MLPEPLQVCKRQAVQRVAMPRVGERACCEVERWTLLPEPAAFASQPEEEPALFQ